MSDGVWFMVELQITQLAIRLRAYLLHSARIPMGFHDIFTVCRAQRCKISNDGVAESWLRHDPPRLYFRPLYSRSRKGILNLGENI